MKNFLVNLATVLALAAGLAIWIMLPWTLVLGIAALIALWLSLTRQGRLALAAAKVGIAGLPQRWGASSVIVVGIAGVVGVLVAMLAMGEGFKATLDATGDEQTAIILRGGSQAETNSVITRDQVPLVSSLPGIAKGADGKPLLSPELSQVVNLPSKSDGTDVNAQFRGVGDEAWAVHDGVRIVEGRKFGAGLREQLIAQGRKLLPAHAGRVEELDREAARLTETTHRRRGERKDLCVPHEREPLRGALRNARGRVFGPRALVPGCQRHETEPSVLAGPAEAETGNREQRAHVSPFRPEQIAFDALGNGQRADLRRAGR